MGFDTSARASFLATEVAAWTYHQLCSPLSTPETLMLHIIHIRYPSCMQRRVPVWDALMCCRKTPPGLDLEEHECAACHSLPAERPEESLQS